MERLKDSILLEMEECVLLAWENKTAQGSHIAPGTSHTAAAFEAK